MPRARHLASLALAALVAVVGAGVAAPSADALAPGLRCSSQSASLKLCSARTDNYKDCFNAPDGLPELRSWLAWTHLRARSATWRRESGQAQFPSRVWVRRSGGSAALPARAYVTVRLRGTSAQTARFLGLRIGPPSTLWGALVQLRSREALAAARVRARVVLHAAGGAELAAVNVSYRRDARLAGAPAGSPEANGPGGRWYVGALRTHTDVELGAQIDC